MAEKYTYALTDFLNNKVSLASLKSEIEATTIEKALHEITSNNSNCDIWFKVALSAGEETTLDSVVAAHAGEVTHDDEPHMPDGRPIVRSDSRPLGFQTYYTMAGDDTTAGIGFGKEFMWDFSDSTTDIVVGDHVPAGYKCKEFIVTFICPIHTKDGALYFFDAPWGCYLQMDIVVPPGNWYPNPAGAVPASALGLPGNDMYANSGSDWVAVANYVMKYRIYGNCPMGDELNAEGCSVTAIPPGWGIRGRVYTPLSDNTSKGFAEIEMHRCHTAVLPGQTLQDIIDDH